ncbi:MAG: ribosome biogenesis GTP-binding protein YihA/YsxC [Coriobacteriales bacterium]|nr:ribosome biogenesis GTP-binding protein YihA/YsxC [Coriobacteriales bacterium]MDD6738966.1 ribosome biogenesis GTP-binding protein YihA/YsxC [Coriobacteriaceae bacterium]MDD6768288.1 ribosome biogenesis GTP-binding protein YihA/YsxC [Coriobacteriaceae bacterium]
MSVNFHNSEFAAAYGTSKQIPGGVLPEIAVCGRSNVGKSSLLNKLMYRKNLAKVSSKPGKTATVNFYQIDKKIHLVDLPGYGYAAKAKSEKERWSELIDGYFDQDRPFAMVLSLVDIRHEATKLDIAMMSYLLSRELPFAVVLTKADKLSRNQQNKMESVIRKQLQLPKEVQILKTSSEKNDGIEDLRRFISEASGK